jgi:hypothetical protein
VTHVFLDRLSTVPSVASGAVFSDCVRYRFLLWRTWDRAKDHAAFIGFNPSTADASLDDPTIRRCRSFAERERLGGFEMLNLFAFRETSPATLWKQKGDIVGAANDFAIDHAMYRCSRIIVAWGALVVEGPAHRRGLIRARVEAIVRIAKTHGRELMCLGTSLAGHPRHPLMLKSETPLERWRPNMGYP